MENSGAPLPKSPLPTSADREMFTKKYQPKLDQKTVEQMGFKTIQLSLDFGTVTLLVEICGNMCKYPSFHNSFPCPTHMEVTYPKSRSNPRCSIAGTFGLPKRFEYDRKAGPKDGCGEMSDSGVHLIAWLDRIIYVQR